MSKRSRRQKKSGRAFAQVHWDMMDTPAWLDLSGTAAKLYLALLREYDGRNNGRIIFSNRDAAQAMGFKSLDYAGAKLDELREHGFIRRTRDGVRGRTSRIATEWRLTDFPTATAPATHDYRRWTPPGKALTGEPVLTGKSVLTTPQKLASHPTDVGWLTPDPVNRADLVNKPETQGSPGVPPDSPAHVNQASHPTKPYTSRSTGWGCTEPARADPAPGHPAPGARATVAPRARTPGAPGARATNGTGVDHEALRGARKRAGLSLAKLAEPVGISAAALSQIETGKKRPSERTYRAIVAALPLDPAVREKLLRRPDLRGLHPEPVRPVADVVEPEPEFAPEPVEPSADEWNDDADPTYGPPPGAPCKKCGGPTRTRTIEGERLRWCDRCGPQKLPTAWATVRPTGAAAVPPPGAASPSPVDHRPVPVKFAEARARAGVSIEKAGELLKLAPEKLRRVEDGAIAPGQGLKLKMVRLVRGWTQAPEAGA